MLYLDTLYFPTLKEAPASAAIASHKLLLRAGMIRQIGSGTYTFMPLGMRVLLKAMNIVREEINATGAQEILMPILQPAELWHDSGRWDDYGPEMMRLTDRHERDICLGPTHEELVTSLVQNELRSYKNLPTTLWQMQVKFRDEMRPRFGLFRTREFIMKDAYSFNADEASLDETYKQMQVAYARICERMGLDWRMVEADPGQIGGNETVEFMALADAGESDLLSCTCGFASDAEVADCQIEMGVADIAESALAGGAGSAGAGGADGAAGAAAGSASAGHLSAGRVCDLEKIETPNVHTIAELAQFLGIPENATVKALSGTGNDGKTYALFIPGDHELNEIKAERVIPGWRLLTDEEMHKAHLHKGSMGPVNLPDGVICVCDSHLKDYHGWAVGANEDGFHYLGAEPGRDFDPNIWADLIMAAPGDGCPKCGKKLTGTRGIEVSQVFKLGTKYSESLNATFMDENGKEKPFVMGCYGIGVTRSVAAVVEQQNDDLGMYWPVSLAPAQVIVLPLQMGDDLVEPLAQKIADELESAGIEVAFDNRAERAGVKFADADLIGWPYQIIIGKRGAKDGKVEFKDRASGEKIELPVKEVVAHVCACVKTARDILQPKTNSIEQLLG